MCNLKVKILLSFGSVGGDTLMSPDVVSSIAEGPSVGAPPQAASIKLRTIAITNISILLFIRH